MLNNANKLIAKMYRLEAAGSRPKANAEHTTKRLKACMIILRGAMMVAEVDRRGRLNNESFMFDTPKSSRKVAPTLNATKTRKLK